MKLTGPMLGTEDAKKLADFYTKMLGKPSWQMEDWYGYTAGEAGLMIGPHSEVKGKNPAPQRIMIMFETDDVPGEFKRIKGLGAEVVAEPYHPDPKNSEGWLSTLADPDGNYIQLASPWKDDS